MRLFIAEQDIQQYYRFSFAESKHIVRVLRLKKNEQLYLTDTKGFFYKAVIIDDNPKACIVEIIDKEQQVKHDYYLHLALAPTKSIDRFEWLIEKATEIGIDEITPIITHYSERKSIKHDRTQRVIEAAMKQSYKAYLPQLNPTIDFKSFIEQEHQEEKQLITHCYDMPKKSLYENVKEKESVLILIGPEGDFSSEEVEMALNKGMLPSSLGDYRLRTETAGVVAVQNIAFINQIKTH